MTKKTKNADRNRPEKTTPSCFAPDVYSYMRQVKYLYKDSVRSKSGFAHTNEYPVSVQSERANDTATVPFSRQKGRRLRHRGETSSLSTAHAETPRHQDRPSEYTPHVRLYPAHAYPVQNVATALQSAHSGSGDICGFFLAWRVYRYTNSDCFHRQIDCCTEYGYSKCRFRSN